MELRNQSLCLACRLSLVYISGHYLWFGMNWELMRGGIKKQTTSQDTFHLLNEQKVCCHARVPTQVLQTNSPEEL